MKNFKHHSYFPKDKSIQAYTFPHVCFKCRKSFAKPKDSDSKVCPECGGTLKMVGRKFSVPKTTNKAQWRKVEFLVENGFVFQSVYARLQDGSLQKVAYPKSLRDAKEFVKKYKEQAIKTQN